MELGYYDQDFIDQLRMEKHWISPKVAKDKKNWNNFDRYRITSWDTKSILDWR